MSDISSAESAVETDLRKRLKPSLLICRIVVAFMFGAWGYGTIIRPQIMADQLGQYYHISGMPTGVMIVLGILQLLIAVAVLVGFQKRITRGILLLLAILGAFMPKFMMGYYIGTIGKNTHPQMLFFTAFCLLAACVMIYLLRDEDTLWSPLDKGQADPFSQSLTERVKLPLFICRLGIVIVFLAWTYDKIFNVRHGVRMFERYYKLPFDANMVQIVGWLELVFVLVIVLGLLKRISRGALIVFAGYTALIPYLLTSYALFFNPNHMSVHVRSGSFDQYFLLQTLAMPAIAIVIYALRDYDTLLSFSKRDRALKG